MRKKIFVGLMCLLLSSLVCYATTIKISGTSPQGPSPRTNGVAAVWPQTFTNQSTATIGGQVCPIGSVTYICWVPTGSGGCPAHTALSNTSYYSVLSMPGAQGATGTTGTTGTAATITFANVSTLAAGSNASGTNLGTTTAANYVFRIPRGATGTTGNTGAAGAAATLAFQNLSTLAPGTSASAQNTGSSTAASLILKIPRGATGATGTGLSSCTAGSGNCAAVITKNTITPTGATTGATTSANGALAFGPTGAVYSCYSGACTQVGAGNLAASGTPTNHQWAVWPTASTIKGVTVTASKVVASDSNGEPTATVAAIDANGVYSAPKVSGTAGYSLYYDAYLTDTYTQGFMGASTASASWTYQFPVAAPTANQSMMFGAPSGSSGPGSTAISSITWGGPFASLASPNLTGTPQVGTGSPFPGSIFAGFGNISGSTQFTIQNTSTKGSASVDYITGVNGSTNTGGSPATGYGDFGQNGSAYGGQAGYTALGPYDVYLYASDANLGIGTNGASSSASLKLFTGGQATSNVRMNIDYQGNITFPYSTSLLLPFAESETSITSTSTGTGNINLDGTAASDYNYNNGSGTATYTPIFTTLPSSGQVRYITATFGGGSGVDTMTWTNVNWIGATGAAATTTTKKSTYACIIRYSTGAFCKIVQEAY